MYYNSLVDIPEVPGIITIRKGVYVMYETGRRYNPEKNRGENVISEMAEALKNKGCEFPRLH